MRSLSLRGKRLAWVLCGGSALGLSAARLEAQDGSAPGCARVAGHSTCSPWDCYAPPPSIRHAVPVPPGYEAAPPREPGEAPPPPPPPADSTDPMPPMPPMEPMADALGDATAAFDPGQSVAGFGASFAANSIGDFIGAPFTFQLQEAGPDGVFGTADDVEVDAASPFSTRTFKIFEGQNARPQDRIFGSLNRFSDVGDINDNNLYRYLVGFERTFLDGRASFGMQLPFYTVDPATVTLVNQDGSERASLGRFGLDSSDGNQSDVGDLTFILKYALYYDECSLDTFSVGVAYTAPTGPDTIANVDTNIDVEFENRGAVQPFAGFLTSLHGNWFAYGFSAIDIPIDSDDTTFWFNDLGIGYYLAQPCSEFITAIVPKLEVHVISPIENRRQNFVARIDDGDSNQRPILLRTDGDNDGDGTAQGVLEIHNQVNITAGVTFEIRRNVTFTFAYVAPVAGPSPFDHELQFQLQCFGGGGRGPMGFGAY
ncbi:MAG TPA: hypothetical protein VML55_23115 [Planctomycetaceae bacterium]|nr:hypothetical protein [Planctomycetaceae bacterium]